MRKATVFLAAVYYALCGSIGFIAAPMWLNWFLAGVVRQVVENEQYLYAFPLVGAICLITLFTMATLPGFFNAYKNLVKEVV